MEKLLLFMALFLAVTYTTSFTGSDSTEIGIRERLESSQYLVKAEEEQRFDNCRYWISSQFWKVCKSTSPIYGTSITMCSKKSEQHECIANDYNTCTDFSAKIEDNLLCPSSCGSK